MKNVKIKIDNDEFELNENDSFSSFKIDKKAFESLFDLDASKLVLECDDSLFEIFSYIDADFDEFSVDETHVYLFR